MLQVHLCLRPCCLPPTRHRLLHCYLLEDKVENVGGREGTQEPAAREPPCPCTEFHLFNPTSQFPVTSSGPQPWRGGRGAPRLWRCSLLFRFGEWPWPERFYKRKTAYNPPDCRGKEYVSYECKSFLRTHHLPSLPEYNCSGRGMPSVHGRVPLGLPSATLSSRGRVLCSPGRQNGQRLGGGP